MTEWLNNEILGISIGYPDPQASVNALRTDRVTLAEVVRWFA